MKHIILAKSQYNNIHTHPYIYIYIPCLIILVRLQYIIVMSILYVFNIVLVYVTYELAYKVIIIRYLLYIYNSITFEYRIRYDISY